MIRLQTSRGRVDWEIGNLATAEPVFLYGYCGNFAYVLSTLRSEIEICGVFSPDGVLQHYVCRDTIGYLDIRGRISKEEACLCIGGAKCASIELQELASNCDIEHNYLAESVIEEHLKSSNGSITSTSKLLSSLAIAASITAYSYTSREVHQPPIGLLRASSGIPR